MKQMDTVVTLVEQLALGMMPSGLVGRMGESDPEIPEHYKEQAQLFVELLKQVLSYRPERIEELGWQRLAVRSENDLLQRTSLLLFAPPERGRA